jgi:ankyrin repeat protein
MLLAKGASVNMKMADGNDALSTAKMFKYTEIEELLKSTYTKRSS